MPIYQRFCKRQLKELAMQMESTLLLVFADDDKKVNAKAVIL